MKFDRKPFPKYFGIDMSVMTTGDHFTIIKSEYENSFYALKYVEAQAKVFNMDIWVEDNYHDYDIWIVKVGLRSTQNIEDRVYDVIAASGVMGIMKADLIKKFSNHTAAQLIMYISKLYDSGLIKKMSEKNGIGRPRAKYISTKSFQQLDTPNEIVE